MAYRRATAPRNPISGEDLTRAMTGIGEGPRFENTPLRVSADTLRDRESDVSKPSELAGTHSTYRRRILMGPTYRADMWAELEKHPTLSAAELARRTYGSFATAWQVKKDYEILAILHTPRSLHASFLLSSVFTKREHDFQHCS